MAKVISSVGTAHISDHGKRMVAKSMRAKGQAFLGAAMLLRRETKGHEFVVLHLLCQGIENLLKGLLLAADYDTYNPRLQKLGHDLVRIVRVTTQVAGVRPLRPPVQAELEALNRLYSSHRLRYGSGYDILVDPATIPSKLVLHRVAALLRLVRRRELLSGSAI